MHREILSLFICLSIAFAGFGQNGRCEWNQFQMLRVKASFKHRSRLISDQDTLATVTDLDGRYQFNAPVGAIHPIGELLRHGERTTLFLPEHE